MARAKEFTSVIEDLEAERTEIKRTMSALKIRDDEVARTISALKYRRAHIEQEQPSVLPSNVEALIGSARSPIRAAVEAVATSHLVLDFITKHPGLTASEIAANMKDLVRSEATDKGKLIHSVIGYLRDKRKAIRKEADGTYHALPVEDRR